MNVAFGLLAESGSAIDRLQGLGSAKDQLGDPDYWGSVGILTITGILVVFLILAILIFFFWLMGTIFKAIDKNKAEKKSAEAEKAEIAAEPVVQTAAVEEEDAVDDDEEIVAVIGAAIAAYAEAEGTAYTIKSISRHKNARARSAWSMAGLSDNMRQF